MKAGLVFALAACSSHPAPLALPPQNHGASALPQPGAPRVPAPIRNDRIQFAAMRPRDATLPTRDRIVVVTAPPEAVALARRGDIALLDQLVALLADPERAWAAEVMLAALTGNEADLANDFQGTPDSFLDALGKTAPARWQSWLPKVRDKLAWDASRTQFVVR